MKIESMVSSGPHTGEVQSPVKDKEGFFVMCEARFEEYKIRVADLESVANGLRAGLRLRKKSPSVNWSMRKPESINIDGKSVQQFFADRGDRT